MDRAIINNLVVLYDGLDQLIKRKIFAGSRILAALSNPISAVKIYTRYIYSTREAQVVI